MTFIKMILKNVLNFLGILDSKIGELIPFVTIFRIFKDNYLFYISYNRKFFVMDYVNTKMIKILTIIYLSLKI